MGRFILEFRKFITINTTDLERLKVYFKNLRPEYKEKSIVKFRVVGRELYPTTAFATTPAELDVKYLPSCVNRVWD